MDSNPKHPYFCFHIVQSEQMEIVLKFIKKRKRKKSWFLTSKQHKAVCLKGSTGKCGRATTIYNLIIPNSFRPDSE